MADKRITIQLHGACIIRGLEPHAFEISGAKHKAIFALMATAPMGRRTRAFAGCAIRRAVPRYRRKVLHQLRRQAASRSTGRFQGGLHFACWRFR